MNLMMYSLILLSTLMIVSSSNILMIWLSLELNMFSFIPLLSNKGSSNEAEASINYFIIQTLGSTLFLTTMTIMLTTKWFMKPGLMFSITAILLKLGAAPCHYWFPVTMELISWTNCLLLSTWQKIGPLFILLYNILPKLSATPMLSIASLNAIIGGVMGLSQSSMKKIMAYSSITHMGWMLSSPIMNMPHLSIMYLFMYTLITIPLFMLLGKMTIYKTCDMWQYKNLSSSSMMVSTLLLSMSGMPPLTGFIPKLLMMNSLLAHSMMVTIILIMGSLMNLFFYLNICLNMLMSPYKSPTNRNPHMTTSTIIMCMAGLLMPLTIIM